MLSEYKIIKRERSVGVFMFYDMQSRSQTPTKIICSRGRGRLKKSSKKKVKILKGGGGEKSVE